MSDKNKQYTNGDLTVTWKPDVCIHAGVCAGKLPGVFNPNARPWVNLEGASAEEIKTQIDQCPSGALSYSTNEAATAPKAEATKIEVRANGPLLVKGDVCIVHKDGTEEKKEKVSLCRCGHSANKPFCDGAHKKAEFKDE